MVAKGYWLDFASAGGVSRRKHREFGRFCRESRRGPGIEFRRPAPLSSSSRSQITASRFSSRVAVRSAGFCAQSRLLCSFNYIIVAFVTYVRGLLVGGARCRDLLRSSLANRTLASASSCNGSSSLLSRARNLRRNLTKFPNPNLRQLNNCF